MAPWNGPNDSARGRGRSVQSAIALCRRCTQKVVTAGAVDRLTDVSKFTGSHKERFTEDGKGKGLAGRRDVVDNSGYVTGFKASSSSSSSAAATATATAAVASKPPASPKPSDDE